MSNTEWTYLLVAVAGWFWLAARLHRLGKQLKAVSSLVRREMAALVDNQDRVHELHEEWLQNRIEEKKANRQTLIGWGIIGALALAWWWFSRPA